MIEANGRLANGDFADYLLPVNADIADVDVHLVEYPDTLHNAVGARGPGEIGTVGMAAAVANAVANAAGIRVRRIPIALEDLLDQLSRPTRQRCVPASLTWYGRSRLDGGHGRSSRRTRPG